jgi:hypothetical protein
MEPNSFASSAITPWGYKAGLVTPVQPTSSCMISLYSSASFPIIRKRENREIDLKENKRWVISAYREAIFLSLWFHGGVGLVCAGGHMRAPAKSCKSRVYDCGRTSYLSCSCSSCIPAPAAGYVMTCSVFYERGFGAPSH